MLMFRTSNRLRIPEVTLVAGIGKEQRVFFLAKYILMEIAPFFRGALERNWFLEGRNNRVMLPEDDVYVWKKAVDFLNTGDFYPRLNIRRSNVSYVGRLHTAPMAHGVFEIEAIDVWC